MKPIYKDYLEKRLLLEIFEENKDHFEIKRKTTEINRVLLDNMNNSLENQTFKKSTNAEKISCPTYKEKCAKEGILLGQQQYIHLEQKMEQILSAIKKGSIEEKLQSTGLDPIIMESEKSSRMTPKKSNELLSNLKKIQRERKINQSDFLKIYVFFHWYHL